MIGGHCDRERGGLASWRLEIMLALINMPHKMTMTFRGWVELMPDWGWGTGGLGGSQRLQVAHSEMSV